MHWRGIAGEGTVVTQPKVMGRMHSDVYLTKLDKVLEVKGQEQEPKVTPTVCLAELKRWGILD